MRPSPCLCALFASRCAPVRLLDRSLSCLATSQTLGFGQSSTRTTNAHLWRMQTLSIDLQSGPSR